MTDQPERPLGLDFISGLATPPVAFIELAADLGCASVSLAPQPLTPSPYGHAPWSLVEDAALRREAKAALADTGIGVSTGEGCFLLPGIDASIYAPALDMFAELGARMLSVVVLNPDLDSAFGEAAKLVEMAQARGLGSAIEFIATTPVGDLATALRAVDAIGGDLKIVIDFMHLYRSGASEADLAALDPALIGQVQICDCPLQTGALAYGIEAGRERMAPGTGELPLLGALRATAVNAPLSLELPVLSKAEAGVPLYEILAPAVTSTRALIAEATV